MTEEELVGTWKLISYTTMSKDGDISYPFGRDCKGYSIFTEEGYVSAHISAMHCQHYTSGKQYRAIPDKTGNRYIACFGSYTLKQRRSELSCKIEISIDTYMENNIQIRHIDYDGEYLTLTDKVKGACLVWEKL